MEQTIPVIDLQAFRTGDEETRREVAEDLGSALVEFGFCGVAFHGVDHFTIADAHTAMKSFFSLPRTCKRRYERPREEGIRGYSPLGGVDAREQWHAGPELVSADPRYKTLGKNIWPSEVPQLRHACHRLWTALRATGESLLEVIAVYLEVEPELLTNLASGGDSILSLTRYPAPASMAAHGTWAVPHEDDSLISLLPETTGRGIELLLANGDWLPVEPMPGQIVVNTGTLMARLTGGLFPATAHRVIAPFDAAPDRYSMPFALNPPADADLRDLSNNAAKSPQASLDASLAAVHNLAPTGTDNNGA